MASSSMNPREAARLALVEGERLAPQVELVQRAPRRDGDRLVTVATMLSEAMHFAGLRLVAIREGGVAGLYVDSGANSLRLGELPIATDEDRVRVARQTAEWWTRRDKRNAGRKGVAR